MMQRPFCKFRYSFSGGHEDPKSMAFGKHYHNCLRREYPSTWSSLDVLDLDVSLLINDRLEVVQSNTLHGGNRQGLIQFLKTSASPNQQDCWVLFAHMLELKPHLGGSHTSILMNCATPSCSLTTKYPM